MMVFFRWLVFGFSVESLFYFSCRMWKKGGWKRYIAIIVKNRISRKYGCYLSPQATVGSGLQLKHPVGIVIGKNVTIGENVTLYQNVTLGAKKISKGLSAYPSIGDDVVVYACSVIVGDVFISSGAIVGASSVVITNVPENDLVAGNPARSLL